VRYIDTNVLVRVITGDVPEQANAALREFDDADQGEFFIDPTVIVELCFVLEYHDYAMTRADIADALLTLISSPQINASKEAVRALELYKKHLKLDFTDCYLFALGGKNGVFTYDKDLRKTLLKNA
jgi:predicted nucleic-acid-binding protein